MFNKENQDFQRNMAIPFVNVMKRSKNIEVKNIKGERSWNLFYMK